MRGRERGRKERRGGERKSVRMIHSFSYPISFGIGGGNCLEFMKCNNPNLPFYYHTSTHTRFYETEMSHLNRPAEKQRHITSTL